ncbi:MAG: class I SAM-dependent methyltransferase [Desulfobacterales bacterium]|nr:class I SAM-dependent methyltransferase [Desulfobacterales bacterium]
MLRTRKAEIAKAFDGVAEYYDKYMEETGHVESQRRVARFIKENEQGLVLDVATGTGMMLEPFDDGVGIDLSVEIVRRAKEKQPDKSFLVSDVHYLPFKTKAFDLGISCLAFLWFDDPEAALKEMLRVCRKVYLVEEEGVPARKRIEIPDRLKHFFETIEKLEREVFITELDAYRASGMYGRVFEADIDGSHKFVCWMAQSTNLYSTT